MRDIFAEKTKSIEGFYTNIAFPGSEAATRGNTTSTSVYKARTMLEQNNKLNQQIASLNKLGQSITEEVDKYKEQSNRVLTQIQADASETDKMKLSNILVNRLYTTPELNQLVRVMAIGDVNNKNEEQRLQEIESGNPGTPNVVWAFKRIYNTIPTTEQYSVEGGLTTNNYGSAGNMKYMVSNQGKKLTFDECKELAAQQGHMIFGLTNTELIDNVYKSTCLLPTTNDIHSGGLYKHGYVKKNPRIVTLTNVGSDNLTISIRDGNLGVTSLHKIVPEILTTVGDSNYYNKTSMSPGFGLVDIIKYDWPREWRLRSESKLSNPRYLGPNGRQAWTDIFTAARHAQNKGYKYFFTYSVHNKMDLERLPEYDRKTNTVSEKGRVSSLAMSVFWSYDGGDDAVKKFYESYINESGPGSGGSYIYKYNNDSDIGSQLINKNVRFPVRQVGLSSFAIWKLDEGNSSSTTSKNVDTLITDGYYNIENVTQQMYLSSLSLSVVDWTNLQKNKTNPAILNNWMSKTLNNAKTTNIEYIGFFYKYHSETDGELIAFGTQTKGLETNSTFTIKDNKGRTYGTQNTITYYMILERGSTNKFGFGRDPNLLGKVAYIDKNKNIRDYTKKMLSPSDPHKTQYEIIDNTKSDYFDMEEVPISELQTLTMTIPACRQLCNKYYDKCMAFVFDAGAETHGMKGISDGSIMPKCSLKTIDPTIYSWATETSEYSRMYKKIPQVNNNWTCTKRFQTVPSSYLLSGQKQLLGHANYIGIDNEGKTIDASKKGKDMSTDEKCGSWAQYDQDAQAMRMSQETIGKHIEEYVDILGQLKTYNKDLIETTKINQPMVDVAVAEYKKILDTINKYTDSGEFRIDKYKAQMSDISRKSDVYIYILWLAIAVIIVFFAVNAIMKIKQ